MSATRPWAVQLLIVVVLVCSSLLEQAASAANLDISEPIIKRSPASGGDRFGYSVVLHRISQPVDTNFESFLNSTRLIVGAPYGTYPGGIPDLPAGAAEPRAGLVYQCPVGPGKCEGVLGGRSGDDRRLFDGDANSALENKTGQLMGSVLHSSGKFFVACAPLYVIFAGLDGDLDDSRPIGRCFVSSSNLENFSEIRPCAGLLLDDALLTIGSDSQCLSGFSAAIINHNDLEGTVVVGALGDNAFSGNLFYYKVNGSAAIGSGVTRNIDTLGVVTYQYEGYSITTGDVTNINSSDIISGVPRNDGATLFGSVRVRTQADLTGDSLPLNLTGTQTGEYFGAAVAAADLNNDGYDEVLVGAPIYTSDKILEIGRVYIFENLGGSLNTTPIILEGTSVQSRFGSSVVSLGDINGDGFHDVAVAAPYEGASVGADSSGTVYIYHGRSSASGLISPYPNQILRAQQVVEIVPGITSLHGFGFSLSSGLDVDGNLYNDLLVGAHTSSTAILIRSLSIAYITVSISTNKDTFQLDIVGKNGSSFDLLLCASYFGHGLDGRPLKTNLVLSEVTFGNRIYFKRDGQDRNILNTDFNFATTQELTCMNLTVFGKSLSQVIHQSNFLSPIQLHATFVGLPRPLPTYMDGSPVQLVDYRDIPLLVVEGNDTVSVVPQVNCSFDSTLEEKCRPDLTVSLTDVAYLDFQGSRILESIAVAGMLQTVRVDLTYSNIGPDPALGSEILFTLPEGFIFTSSKAPKGSQEVKCQEDSATSRLYRCPLVNYIPPNNEAIANNGSQLSLIWRLSRSLVGNEPMQTSNISIRLTSTRDVETDTSNNDLIGGPVQISYAAIADLDISSFKFTITVPTYRRITHLVTNPNILQIGRIVELSLRAVNRGPSNSPNTVVDIYIPTNDTRDSFYLYLTNVTAKLSNGLRLPCDLSGVNPQGLQDYSTLPLTVRRKRRSLVENKHIRQASTETEITKDCSELSERESGRCTHISCSVENFATLQVVEIVIYAALDDRFFQTQVAPFLFVAYSNIRNTDSFLEDLDQSNNWIATSPYRVTFFMEQVDSSFPIWIPILCGIVAVITIICLFILLYCVGFFRRKKRGAAEFGEVDVETYREDPLSVDGKAADVVEEKNPELRVEPVDRKPMNMEDSPVVDKDEPSQMTNMELVEMEDSPAVDRVDETSRMMNSEPMKMEDASVVVDKVDEPSKRREELEKPKAHKETSF